MRPSRSVAASMLPLALSAALVVGTVATGSTDALAAGPSVKPPPKGAYLGAYPTLGTVLPEVSRAQLRNFEWRSGNKLAFVVFESPWDVGFPIDAVRTIAANGSIPLIQWEPWAAPYDDYEGPGTFSLSRIASGRHDSYIRGWAEAARAYGKPLMVVLADEMNGDWFPWSGRYNGRSRGPERFVAAWRHVVDIARQRGAHNITWVWQPTSESDPDDDWNDLRRYYPGHDYVDWIGASLFGRQTLDEPWRGFQQLMDPLYREWAAIDGRRAKPWMLVEWAVADDPRKPAWIADGLRLMQTRYPRVRAAAWWDDRFATDDDEIVDLRVSSSTAAQNVYKRDANAPHWVDRPAG